MGDLSALPDLGWFQETRWLPTHFVAGLAPGVPSELGIQLAIIGGKTTARRTARTGERTQAQQKLKSFVEPGDARLMSMLNRQLAGERDFPVVATLVGAAVGKLGVDYASQVYSAASQLGSGQASGHVFVRDRDEIWRAEALGKLKNDPVYVITLLLVDPYRTSPSRSTWVLHQQRYPLTR